MKCKTENEKLELMELYEKEMEELEAEYIRLGELKPVKEPLQIFKDEPATKTCRVIIRNRGAKYYTKYNDVHNLTESEIEFLTSRNTGKNIISKLELIHKKESLEDAYADFCPGSQFGNLTILINELKEIQEKNGKISISKHFKCKIEITEVE